MKSFKKFFLENTELDEAKKPKPGHNAAVLAKNISKVMSAVKKEEVESQKFKKGDKVHYETSRYSKDNPGVVHSHDGDQVTIKGKDWLGGDQMIKVHQGFVRKQK
jgi:hypothetical protein